MERQAGHVGQQFCSDIMDTRKIRTQKHELAKVANLVAVL